MAAPALKPKLVAALGAKASEVDDQVLEYVAGMIADSSGETVDDIVEAAAPFLIDTGCLADRPALRKVIEAVTGRESCAPPPTTAAKPLVQKLAAPVSMKTVAGPGQDADELSEWRDYIERRENPSYVDQAALRKAEEKMKERAEKRAAREAAKQQRDRERAGLAGQSFNYSGLVHQDADAADDGGATGRDIHAENISVSFGKLVLLEGASLSICYGRHYGLVGRNGCGKSTLLRFISHREVPFSKRISVLHVEQEVVGDDTPVLQSVLDADVERTQLLKDEARLLAANPNSEKLGDIYRRLSEIDADGAESRASAILSGLSFTEEMKQQPTRMFSGGWRMRVSLARALFCQPDLLLLDEPSNHLDFHAVIWLEHFLTNWPKTLIIVSHQRDFLNEVITDVVHLYGRKLTYYRGNYDTFERVANERIQHQKAEYEAQLVQRQHVQRFIDRFRYNAKRASLVQSRLKMLEKSPLVSAVVEEGSVILPFPDPDPVPPPILQFVDVSFAFNPEHPIFEHTNFSVDTDSRIALVGANGCGKTTLLKLLVGELEPTKGHVIKSGKVRVGLFSQHFVDQLDLTVSSVEWLQRQFAGLSSQDARTHLGKYGIIGDTALQTLNTLSGGQKSRVVFAQIAMRKPHVLLLDEPSNHLDIETIEGLAQSLTAFQGGVLIVSHDQRLIKLVTDEVWVVGEKSVKRWPGDVATYKKHIESSMQF